MQTGELLTELWEPGAGGGEEATTDKLGQPTPSPQGPGRGQAAAGEGILPLSPRGGCSALLPTPLIKESSEVPLQINNPRVWAAPGSHGSSSLGFVSLLGLWGMRPLTGSADAAMAPEMADTESQSGLG